MSVSKSLRFKVLTRDRFTCRYCGRSAPSVVLHVDHIHPVSRGGTDDETNLVAACVDCNSSKSGKIIPLSPPPIPDALKTLPHVDRCRACQGMTLHAAIGEEPRGSGYVAFYRCPQGHAWWTWWSNSHRLTPDEISALEFVRNQSNSPGHRSLASGQHEAR